MDSLAELDAEAHAATVPERGPGRRAIRVRGGAGLSLGGDIAGASAELAARPDLGNALGAAFDAVVTPELWPQVTEDMAAALGGLGICFHEFGAHERRFQAPMSARYREMLTEFIGGGWAGQDLRASRGWPLMKGGQNLILEDDVSTPEERARLPIYTELFRRHDLDMLAGIGVRRPGRLWTVNILRSARSGPWDGEALQRMSLAQPYLARLLAFAEVMASNAQRSALSALEHSATAALLVDAQGRVLELNRPAGALIGRGLTVRGGRLATEGAAAQAALDDLIAAALRRDTGRAGVADRPVCLPREGRPALLVDALPCRDQLADAFGRTGAILMFTDLELRKRPPHALLRRLYGLTGREAEVAALIGAGCSVEEASDTLGLRVSSVRQLVKAVLSKAGLGRQAELVAAVARLPHTP